MSLIHRRWRSSCALVALVLLWLLRCAQATEEPSKVAIDRLFHLGKLWNTVKYFHPYLAYRDVDWDAALIAAVPKVKAAKSSGEYKRAVEELLDSLHDPVTHLSTPEPKTAAPPPSTTVGVSSAVRHQWLAKGILLVKFEGLSISSLFDLQGTIRELDRELLKAKAVIFDLRVEPGFQQFVPYILAELQNVAPSREIGTPGQRSVMHWGYRGSSTYEMYSSKLVTKLGERYAPKKSVSPKKYAFLVGAKTRVPPLAVALQASGDGFIVSEGRLSEAAIVLQTEVDLGEGLAALVRTGELEYGEGAVPFHADAEESVGGDLVKIAVSLLEHSPAANPRKIAPAQPLPPGVFRPDNPYRDEPYPPEPLRLLAAYRIWAVARWFYPYRHLLKEDWDQLLADFIPRLSLARNEKEYALTLAEMATHIADTHTRVTGFKALTEVLGESSVPLRLRYVEGRYAVTEIDVGAAKDVAVGDVVIAVDGKLVEERAALLSKYLATSIPELLPSRVALFLLSGDEGSVAKVKLSNAKGELREVKLQRSRLYYQNLQAPLVGEPWRILADNIGFLDLRLLKPDQVDASLEKLKDTRALIIDLRTYPNGVFPVLGPRLNIKNATVAAQFYEPLVSAQNPDGRSYFEQPIPATAQWKYAQPVVVLIDERAISQSEHTGLWLEATHDVVFIGSRTCGANGDVTSAALPGGGTLMFGGHDVRHADGRQLQRVGLIPNIEVKPTLAGIRAGRDEVLERAMKYVNDALAPRAIRDSQ